MEENIENSKINLSIKIIFLKNNKLKIFSTIIILNVVAVSSILFKDQ